MNYPILHTEKEILQKLRQNLTPATKDLLCFFSCNLSAYITDPLFMTIPLEDKIVHRGYSVFETTKIFGNKIYQLDKHIDRFEKSINYINLKSKYSHSEFKSIITNLSALARSIEKERDIEIRYFYSAGVGNFSVVVDDSKHTFYAFALRAYNELRPVNGTEEFSVKINELKSQAAKSKNTNYLINAMTTKQSKDKGGFLGIMTDTDGSLLESPISNVAFYLEDGSFCVPPFEKTLAGTTVIRCMDFIEKVLIPEGIVKGIVRDYVTIEDVKVGRVDGEFTDGRKKVKEIMMLGGDFLIPILKLDGMEITKEPGVVARRLQEFLINDKKGEESSEPVPELDF